MKKHLSFFSQITKTYFYLEQVVKDSQTGKTGIVREIKPFGINECIIVLFKSGKKIIKKEELLNLSDV